MTDEEQVNGGIYDNFILPSGDVGILNDTDWKLSEFGEVLDMIQKMPKLDCIIKHYSQYEDTQHLTACTMYCGMDGISTIENKKFSKRDIQDVIDLGINTGWVPGLGWVRGAGCSVVRKSWNEKYPDNKVLSFVVEYGTPEFELVIEKFGIVIGSINVDSAYWKDVRDNLTVDGCSFARKSGHATCFMKVDGKYICPDSVPRLVSKSGVKQPMLYTVGDEEKFGELIENGNIKKDFHIFIMEKWLATEISAEERQRLESFRDNLNKAIEANSAIRNLTNQESEKQERNRQNNYNRGKLRVIESMLTS